MQLSLKTPAQYRIRAQVKTYASRRILSWLELGTHPKLTQIARVGEDEKGITPFDLTQELVTRDYVSAVITLYCIQQSNPSGRPKATKRRFDEHK